MATDYTKLILDQISDKASNIDPKYVSLMLWIFGTALGFLFCYSYFTILRKRSELKSKKYILKLAFSSKSMEKGDLILEFTTLLSKLHSLSKGGIITFELHQNKSQNIKCFVITTSKLSVLQSVKLELDQIKGADIQITETDPLLLFQTQKANSNPKPHLLKLASSSTFGNLKADSTVFIKNLIQNLNQLENQDFGSVVVVFRASFAQNKIRSQISNLNFKAMKKGKNYGIDQNLLKEVKELEIKNISAIFSVDITVIGSSSFVVDNLAACFNLLASQNYFVTKMGRFEPQKLRYTKALDLFAPLNRGSYGSYLNCNELASIVQLSDFGFENISKNALPNTILENSITSFKDIL